MGKREFTDLFAGWLIGQGEVAATEVDRAQKLAWDFVNPAWEGNDYLPDWIRAWEYAAQDTEADFA